MNYKVTLTENHMRTLSGMLDAAAKALGVRALRRDVTELVETLDMAEQVPTAAYTPPQDS